jgi:malate dehydrogenase (oxaloacetate-decarboxylating)
VSQVKKDWFALAEKLHKYYQGKIEVAPKCSITSFDDFNIWYTPGVAEPCKRIGGRGPVFRVHVEVERYSCD